MRSKFLVKAEVLKWARESLNIPLYAAAKKIDVDEDTLSNWEVKDTEISLSRLRNLAKAYKRSLGIFFLEKKPDEAKTPTDFRRTRAGTTKLPTEVLLTIRRAREIQQNALELELIKPRSLPTTAKLNEEPHVVATRFRENLGVSLEEQSKLRDAEFAYRFWKIVLEDQAGVLIIEQSMPQSEIRAFSINHKQLPVIVINSKDENSSKTFSLFHEMYHVMLGEEGICKFGYSFEQNSIEAKCNQFAASFLVPYHKLKELVAQYRLENEVDYTDDEIKKLASKFKVSRFVILGRLLFIGTINEDFYKDRYKKWIAEYERYKKSKEDDDIFVNFADRRLKNNGFAYTSAVIEAYQERRISKRDVANLLQTDLKYFNQLAQKVRDGYGRYRTSTN